MRVAFLGNAGFLCDRVNLRTFAAPWTVGAQVPDQHRPVTLQLGKFAHCRYASTFTIIEQFATGHLIFTDVAVHSVRSSRVA